MSGDQRKRDQKMLISGMNCAGRTWQDLIRIVELTNVEALQKFDKV